MRRWSLTIFLYFFIRLNLAIGLTHCDSNSNQKYFTSGGMISPAWRAPIPDADIILEVGTPLEIYCTLDLNYKHAGNYTSQDIIFKKGDRKIDSENVTLVNSTTARLFLNTSTISVQTEIFACWLTLHGGGNNATSDVSNSSDSGTEIPLNNDPKTPVEDLICSSSVRIGSKPKKVVNFKCLSHNWDVLDCWWHEPNNGIETHYSIYYSTSGEAGENQLYGCPTDQSEPGHCRWTKETSPSYKENFEFMNFFINGSNMFGNITQKFRWHHYAHIVPAQPYNLTLLRTTSHSVFLQWDDVSSRNASLINLLYLIKYKRPTLKSWNIIYFHSKDVEKENDHVQVNITGIKYPNMEYSTNSTYTSVNAIGSAPRSSIVYVPEQNDILPRPNPDYMRFNGTDVYEITVLSNLLDKFIRRQIQVTNFTFFWCESNHGDPYPCSNVFNWINLPVTNIISHNFAFKHNVTLNKHIGYQFAASTNSLNSSSGMRWIICKSIYNQVNKIQNVWIQEVGSSFVDIHWKLECANWAEGFKGYKISYCPIKEYHQHDCVESTENDLIRYYARKTTSNFNFTNLMPNTTYKMAVAAPCSGMSWIIYTGIYNQVNKIQNVWIQEVGSSFVDIHWKLEFANRVQGFKGYKISYCPVNENHQHDCVESTEKHLKYHAGKNVCDFNFTNLMPNTTYKMAVAVWTGELLGPWSELMYPRTKNAP
ncbi:uncharacterized protein LOC135834092 [Planococcus citri]|uniref:uncharacterized protein LOC135834092 n=1 Tax=Planococcus citri TaxID=170843 RepID=UPI0031F88F5E